MNKARLYLIENPYCFSGLRHNYEESFFSIVGVPFDGTTSFRPGSRFGPASIRLFSTEAETLSLEDLVDLEKIPVSDLGDVAVTFSLDEVLNRVETVCRELFEDSKIPVLLGGEHTITLGAVRALKPELLVCFDAHFDYRDEYPQGVRVSHATVMRRISEDICRVVHVGVRATCREEVEYARSKSFLTSKQVLEGFQKAYEALKSIVEEAESLYISIDLDVLDPAYAPGVGNPEACGLSTSTLLNLLENSITSRLIGIDLVELNPLLDFGGSSTAAAVRILFQAIVKTAKKKGLV
ncbi:MAG: agmatinase [Nitrososphaerota archaeon]|nr:agmatinase [Nitrososphaerota archaeon]